ncbi:aminotransferase class I/II-fold pyridoxal phosphate-dependent enzyme [Lactobacillus sp. S2-2]|uniref:aminotransferase-like domain-containing protein n=1 Tax=Lactobacillus sp. S2-2 TaxID=2692917 RepID=UPI001F27E781|nr:PLP-dependent aminotransferase family protein [Lactobacillus sp. S2-2]MCF6515480.1 aminotransferase class I/II-fold pyridoxal phosphate-dependent enzyme [Lactobacillus sp. S2-2]
MDLKLTNQYPLTWKPKIDNLKKPLYQSLVTKMEADIEEGLLLPHSKLPPQRELAYYLDVSFSTISRAYKLSQQKGLTYGTIGKGTYISSNVNQKNANSRNKNEEIDDLGFVSSFEETNSLLKSTIKESMNQNKIEELLNYESPTGLDKHKKIAIKYLKRIGMNCNYENTIISSGGLNSIAIALIGLFHYEDKIIVDKYTFVNFINLSQSLGIKLIPVDSDEHGIKSEKIEQLCRLYQIKGIYLMANYNNPTTFSMSKNRKLEIADIIKKNNLILIEDDYANFVNVFSDTKNTYISSLVPEQSIYICSMSKTIASGLRVSFMRFAKQFKNKLENTMFNTNVKTSSLNVDIVTRALENGIANKIMLQKIKMAKAANQIFDSIFNSKEKITEKHYFFRIIPVTNEVDKNDIEQLCLSNNIRVFHSDNFLVGEKSDNDQSFLRISLASYSDNVKLRDVLRKLHDLLGKENLLI